MALISEASELAARCDPKSIKAAVAALTAKFGNRLVTSQAVREQHANTTTWIANQPPDAVVFPQTTEDVQDVVRICAAQRVPVIAFGTGTSLEGHVNAPFGGVSIDFRDMNRVLAVNAEDLDCVVEPGITRKQLNEHLRDQGLFFPLDPGRRRLARRHGGDALLGHQCGALRHHEGQRAGAEGGAAQRRVDDDRAPRQEVVGRLRSHPAASRLGRHARRDHRADAQALRHSRGDRRRASARFPSVEAACNAAIADHPVRHPGGAHRAARRAAGEGDQRLFQAHAAGSRRCCSSSSTASHGRRRRAVASASARSPRELGGGPFDWATKPEDRTRLWQARHDAYWAGRGLRPGAQAVATDVCVPISRLAECVTETQRDIAESGLVAPILGHVGDGNFHLTLLVDMADADEVAPRQGAVRAAGRAGAGHGRHLHRRAWGRAGQDELSRRRASARPRSPRCAAIKRALDPHGIMNPGKIVPLG